MTEIAPKQLYGFMAVGFLVWSLTIGTAAADVITIPQSALIPSTTYYTDSIGGGIGPEVEWNGGVPRSSDPVRNDDAYRGPLPLGFSLSFFGNTYTEYFLNNNGNISFDDGIPAFTPTGPQGAAEAIISPFFADVDTRNLSSGVAHLRTDIPNQLIVTWDQVGYFSSHADKLNSFQLVVRGPDYAIPAGEGRIGFFYKTMQWETGDASDGAGGFGGTPAAVGFGDGLSNGNVLAGSIGDGISGVVNNHHIWFDVGDEEGPVVTPPINGAIPEPASLILLGSGLAALAAWRFWKQA